MAGMIKEEMQGFFRKNAGTAGSNIEKLKDSLAKRPRQKGIVNSGPSNQDRMAQNRSEGGKKTPMCRRRAPTVVPWPEAGGAHGIWPTDHGWMNRRHQKIEEDAANSPRRFTMVRSDGRRLGAR